MIPIPLGTDRETNRRIYLDPDAFRTHWHLVGATGSGKSTALLTLLESLLLQPGQEECCLFLIDPIGNLSRDLLNWFAHPTRCNDYVRDRLVYFEAANEDYILPFNPLTYTTEGSRYYQTMRSVDIVLRAWAAQDVTQQPRLLQWTYKAFCAAAQMGMPIAMCEHLLHPGTPEHTAILQQIPGDIRHHWQEILSARGNEAVRILESTRNRLDPFFQSTNLNRMFGARQSRFNVERMIRERKIVICNLGCYGIIPPFVADTIGGLVLNEVLETANRLSTREGRQVVDPTYVVMDEFQRFVGVDIEHALPTVRQMGLRLMLAHQSFSQLERPDVDLTQMIWQARSRLMFAASARDADIVADELAKLTFDPLTIKDQRSTIRQLITGYRKEWLESESRSSGNSGGESQQNVFGYGTSATETRPPSRLLPTEGKSRSDQHSEARGQSSGWSETSSSGRHESVIPEHRTFREVTNVTYESFDEFAIKWGQKIRRLSTGESFLQLVNDPEIRPVLVDYVPIEPSHSLDTRLGDLLARNFESDFFITKAEADREREDCRRWLLTTPAIRLPDQTVVEGEATDSVSESATDPFR
ncbi:DUF87 domain-containing protein [bacterium]|nr:DUF87 domain-containing protein [bacterium]